MEDLSDEDTDGEDFRAKIVQIKEHDKFQFCVGGAIGMSTVSMALETDYEGWPGWTVVNACFLLFFLFEISLRIISEKCYFLSCSNPDIFWNIFDFSIVSMSCLDWVVNALTAGGGQMMKYVLVLRTVRILRILRVLRLFKSFTQLSMLVAGLLESFRSVMWIGVMIFIVMLMYAIFLTVQVGKAHNTDGEGADFGDNADEVEKYFGTVTSSLTTLFQFLTFDDWSSIAALITDTPGMEYMTYVFWSYVFIAAFAMLGLLTGVVTDHMNEVSQNQKQEQAAEANDDLDEFVKKVRDQFEEKIPRISKGDFKDLVRGESYFGKELSERGVSVNATDADDLFECLDRDRDGFLTWEEVSVGLKRMRGELQAKDMLRIRFAAERVSMLLGGGDEAVTLAKLREVNEVMDDVDKRLLTLQKHLQGFIHARTSGINQLRRSFRRGASTG